MSESDERKSALANALAAAGLRVPLDPVASGGGSMTWSTGGSLQGTVTGSSAPSVNSAALARLAAASEGTDRASSDQLQLLLAQRLQQQQQLLLLRHQLPVLGNEAQSLLGLDVSPRVTSLLTHQRLQHLQQQASGGSLSAALGGGGTAGLGMNLSSLGLLQQRQSELLLAEQVRQHQERLVAAQMGPGAAMKGISGGATSLLGSQDTRTFLGATTSSTASLTASLEPTAVQSDVALASASAVNGAEKAAIQVGSTSDGRSEAKVSEEPDDKDLDESSETFPFKLYRILEEAEKDGNEGIVSFNAQGRCFLIHKPKQFVDEIMPKYFTTGRMSSFQRQLNLYGFRRIGEGPDKGGYIHEHFLRGKKSLCKKIKRKKPTVKLPPPGLLYSLAGDGGPGGGVSVRHLIAEGQIPDPAIAARQMQLAQQLDDPGGLAGAYGLPDSSLATILQLRQSLRQQQLQSEMLQQRLLQQRRQHELELLLQQQRLQEQQRGRKRNED